jgi:hypothetical protein
MDISGRLLSQLRSGRRRASPTSRADHPDGSLPCHHTVKDVLGYRDVAGREFVRGVAHGTHRQRCRHRHADVSRPDMTSSQPTIFAPLADEIRTLSAGSPRAYPYRAKAVYHVGHFLRVTSLPRAQRFCRLLRHTSREAPHQPPNRPLWRRVGGAP